MSLPYGFLHNLFARFHLTVRMISLPFPLAISIQSNVLHREGSAGRVRFHDKDSATEKGLNIRKQNLYLVLCIK